MLTRNSDDIVDNIYLNLSINNTTTNTTSPAQFSATYDQPILDRPSDYYCSVVKFEIPLQTLPLIVFPLESAEEELANNSAGVVTQVGTTITGSLTKFNQLMIGASITHSGGTATIVSVQNPNTMVVSAALVASNSNYAIGVTGVGTVSQGSPGSPGFPGVPTDIVTGVGTAFTPADVGQVITINGISQNISSYISPTQVRVSSQNIILAGATYIISDYTVANNSNRFNLSSGVVGICQNNQPGSLAGIAPYTAIPAFTENLVYMPANQFISRGDLRYPYVYSYEVLMQYANTSLRAAWVNAGSPGGVGAEPFFSYDPETSFVNIIMPTAFVEAGANGWTVCFNNAVQSIIPSYPIYLTNDPAFPNGRYEINTNQFAGQVSGSGPGYDPFFFAPREYFTPATAPAPFPPSSAYIVTQDYQTIDYINSVRKIVLLTNSIPTRKEFYPPANTSNSGLANSIPILADFQIDLNNTAGAQRSVAIYDAQIYRLIDMVADYPMKKIDISLFWADQQNNLYPIYLNKKDSATIKLGFFSKKLYENSEMKM